MVYQVAKSFSRLVRPRKPKNRSRAFSLSSDDSRWKRFSPICIVVFIGKTTWLRTALPSQQTTVSLSLSSRKTSWRHERWRFQLTWLRQANLKNISYYLLLASLSHVAVQTHLQQQAYQKHNVPFFSDDSRRTAFIRIQVGVTVGGGHPYPRSKLVLHHYEISKNVRNLRKKLASEARGGHPYLSCKQARIISSKLVLHQRNFKERKKFK